MKYLILFTFIISTLLFSCQSGKYQKEISALDSLHNLLNIAEQQLASTDTAKVRTIKAEMQKNMDFITENYKDTFSMDMAMMLSDYAFPKKKVYRNFIGNYSKFLKDIEYTRSQLSNLKQDLENKSIPEDKVLTYFTTEQNAVLTICNTIDQNVNTIQTYFLRFDTLHPKVLHIVDSIKTAQNMRP
ncbi:MAG: hypothetical protein HUU48_07490 [Flavobacteriales bacterium]|nr:hypothetical protein [Flavobacteriales bacterium]